MTLRQFFDRLSHLVSDPPASLTPEQRIKAVRQGLELAMALEDLEARLAAREERIMKQIAALEERAKNDLLVTVWAVDEADAVNRIIELSRT